MKLSDKLKTVKLSEIKPFSKNAKLHTPEQISLIKKSIQNNQYIQPLVIDKNNEIVIGHARYMALCELNKNKDISVEVVNADYLNKTQIKALRILDNKANESEWDFSLLREAIDDLSKDDLGEEIINLTGFDLNDINIDIIEEDEATELGGSGNPNTYGGDAMPIIIGQFKCYINDKKLQNYIEKLYLKFEKKFGSDQKRMDMIGINLIKVIKQNENIFLEDNGRR